MPIENLTFVVFTYNEEARLPLVIRNFKDFGPILVVDNYSSDRTVEIARDNGCQLLLHKNKGWVEDLETTDIVKAAVNTEWLYWGFADEVIDKPVLDDIERVIKGGKHDVIKIMRKNYLYGDFCGDVASSYQTKVFKKHGIDFTNNKIHGFGAIKVPENRVYAMRREFFIHHLISNNIESYLRTLDRYSSIESAQMPMPAAVHGLRMFAKPLRNLIADLFLRGGWRAGLSGSLLAALIAIEHVVTMVKRYEPKDLAVSDSILSKNLQIATGILDRFAQQLSSADLEYPSPKVDEKVSEN